MKGKYLSWFLLAAVSAAFFLVTYRSSQAQPDEVATTPPEIVMMPSHGIVPNGEHELSALRNDLGKNPNHVPILLRMAQVSRDLGKLNDSARYLQDAVKQDPMHQEARLELGRALYDAGDFEGAIRETERLLEIDPSNVDALYNLGAIYGNLSKDHRAREYWERAAAISPDSPSGRLATENLRHLR